MVLEGVDVHHLFVNPPSLGEMCFTFPSPLPFTVLISLPQPLYEVVIFQLLNQVLHLDPPILSAPHPSFRKVYNAILDAQASLRRVCCAS